MKYTITIQDQLFEVEVGAVTGDRAEVVVNQTPYTVKLKTAPAFAPEQPATAPGPAATAPEAPTAPVTSGGTIVAPIPGIIISFQVQVGDPVTRDQVVAVMEAMKMENKLTSHTAGTVKEIRVAKGAEVSTGDVIMVIG